MTHARHHRPTPFWMALALSPCAAAAGHAVRARAPDGQKRQKAPPSPWTPAPPYRKQARAASVGRRAHTARAQACTQWMRAADKAPGRSVPAEEKGRAAAPAVRLRVRSTINHATRFLPIRRWDPGRKGSLKLTIYHFILRIRISPELPPQC